MIYSQFIWIAVYVSAKKNPKSPPEGGGGSCYFLSHLKYYFCVCELIPHAKPKDTPSGIKVIGREEKIKKKPRYILHHVLPAYIYSYI